MSEESNNKKHNFSLWDILYLLSLPLVFTLPSFLVMKEGYKIFKIIPAPSIFYNNVIVRFIILYFESVIYFLLLLLVVIGLIYLIALLFGKSITIFIPSKVRQSLAAFLKKLFNIFIIYSQRFIYSLGGAVAIVVGIILIVCEHTFRFLPQLPPSVYLTAYVVYLTIFIITRGTIHEENKNRFDSKLITTVDCLMMLLFIWQLYVSSYYKSVTRITGIFTFLMYIQIISKNISQLIDSVKNKEIVFQKIITSFVTYVLAAIIMFGFAFKVACLSCEGSSIIEQHSERALYTINGDYLSDYEKWKTLDNKDKAMLSQDDFKVLYYSLCYYFGFNADGFESRGMIRVITAIEIIYAYIVNILIVAYGISLLVTYELRKKKKRIPPKAS